jgi:hypothetical protein
VSSASLTWPYGRPKIQRLVGFARDELGLFERELIPGLHKLGLMTVSVFCLNL